MNKPRLKEPSPNQRRAFIEAAKSIEADEDEKRWETRLKTVVKPSAPPPPKKRAKQP